MSKKIEEMFKIKPKKKKVSKVKAKAAPKLAKKKRKYTKRAGKNHRVAKITQTKNGFKVQFYKPKQLHFRFPKL